jgi:Rrf2 family protein
MQLNRSTDYAIQMLVYLAKARRTVSSSKLAAAIGVSHRYLLQISAKLRAAGFIRAAHGPSGGLNLAKNPEDISLYDVILSMEGVVQTGKICGLPSDELEREMVTLEIAYQRLNILLAKELREVTLSDIIGKGYVSEG